MATSNPISITAPPGLVSIIIPCCGMLDYTKLCVPSVLRHSREPFELIFLDIGSLDGTAEYLAGLRDGLCNRHRVEIGRGGDRPEHPRGGRGRHPGSARRVRLPAQQRHDRYRQVAGCADGAGTIFPEPWDGRPHVQLRPPKASVSIPCPTVSAPRRGAKPGDPLIDVAAVEAFARDHHGQLRGKWLEIEALAGFCLLIRREALTRIRPALAKWTDLSLFDTDIAGKKARQEGFQLVVCRDLFIHHFGTRTFAHGAPASVTGAVAEAR